MTSTTRKCGGEEVQTESGRSRGNYQPFFFLFFPAWFLGEMEGREGIYKVDRPFRSRSL